MNFRRFELMTRARADGQAQRRDILRGLTALTLAGSITPLLLAEDAEAKKRKKKRKKKRNRRGKDGGGGGGNDCQLTICNGQCVDLSSDPNNCGACENSCDANENETCVAGQCVAIFGSEGSGEGQFLEPTGVALNGEGQAFVTDTGNDRLVFLDGGEFDKANFVQPGPVAIGNNGQVYVTDLSIVRVIRLASDGTFLNSFGGQDEDDEAGDFLDPFGVAIDPVNDQVYVADAGNHRIQHFLANGQPLGLFGEQGAGAREFNEPRGVAVNRKSEVIVADSGNNRIQVFEHRPVQNDFVLVRAFGSAGSGNGEFDTPIAVAVDSDDNIYVADLLNNRVQQFTDDGQFVATFGRSGNAPGEFNRPTAIAIDKSGLIYVVDQGNHRVQRFSPPGTGVTAAKRRA